MQQWLSDMYLCLRNVAMLCEIGVVQLCETLLVTSVERYEQGSAKGQEGEGKIEDKVSESGRKGRRTSII